MLYVQGIAFHGVSTVKVEKLSAVTSRDPSFHSERIKITIVSKVGDMDTESVITVFGEDSKELKLEV